MGWHDAKKDGEAMREPKNLDKYLSPRLAAARLLELAVEHVLMLKDGYIVRWKLQVWYWKPRNPKDDGDSKVMIRSSSFSSGEKVEGV